VAYSAELYRVFVEALWNTRQVALLTPIVVCWAVDSR